MSQERIFETINGTEIDVTTVMDKTVEYIPTAEEVEKVKAGVKAHLDEFFPGLLDEETGLDVMFRENGVFWKEKGWLIAAMKSHPGYNGNLQIVLKKDVLHRAVNSKEVFEFFGWAADKLVEEKTYLFRGKEVSYEEYYRRQRDILNKKERLLEIRRNTYSEQVFIKTGDLFDLLHKKFKAFTTDLKYKKEYVALDVVRDWFCQTGEAIVDQELADKVNDVFSDTRFTCPGQKISRLVGKIAKRTPLTKIVDIQDVSFLDQNGERHYKTKDFGWNYRFAGLGDAINPLEIPATTVISVNPVDFLRMSFGHKWASCMTTDKRNRRGADNNYHGMYCGGTESYMLDESTFLMYTLPADFEGDEPEWEDKLKRCNFHIGEDKIIQGRVYPDGRDGGDASISGDMRRIAQRVISELFDAPNYWDLKKGTSECSTYTLSRGVHYRDYLHYGDCTVSHWKRIDGFRNGKYIKIGHSSICPECGREHDTEDNVFCEDCQNPGYTCEECGCCVDRDDVVWVNGNPYCSDCVFYCERCGEYHLADEMTWIPTEDGYVCDDCRDRLYVYSEERDEYLRERDAVETEEGNYYRPDSDGYGTCYECGEYHDADNLIYDDETEEYYCEDCYAELIRQREAAEEQTA